MRILILGLIATTIGASAGVITTRMRFSEFEEAFDVMGTVSETDSTDAPPTKLALVGGGTKDFGLVQFDSEQEHIFQLRNEGDAPLRVSTDTVSCGLCVLTDFKSAVVAPGKTLDIPVTLRARKKGPKLNERLELRTNDPAKRAVALHLVAYVGSAVRLTSDSLPLGGVDAIQGAEGSCQIHGYFSDEIEFTKSEFLRGSNLEFFEFDIKQLDVAGLVGADPYVRTAYEVTVRVKPGIPLGKFQHTLRLTGRVEGHEDTQLDLPIDGQVEGAISFFGPNYSTRYGYLGAGRVSGAKGKTWHMKVMVKGPQHGDIQLTIDSIDPANCLTASLGDPEVGEKITMHPLTITVPKGAPAVVRLGNEQADAGRIVIKTTHPTSKEVVLPIRFAVE